MPAGYLFWLKLTVNRFMFCLILLKFLIQGATVETQNVLFLKNGLRQLLSQTGTISPCK